MKRAKKAFCSTTGIPKLDLQTSKHRLFTPFYYQFAWFSFQFTTWHEDKNTVAATVEKI